MEKTDKMVAILKKSQENFIFTMVEVVYQIF